MRGEEEKRGKEGRERGISEGRNVNVVREMERREGKGWEEESKTEYEKEGNGREGNKEKKRRTGEKCKIDA